MTFKMNPNFEKDLMKEIKPKLAKMSEDYIKKFKCPVCGKSPLIKSTINDRVEFDCCHEELEAIIKKELK